MRNEYSATKVEFSDFEISLIPDRKKSDTMDKCTKVDKKCRNLVKLFRLENGGTKIYPFEIYGAEGIKILNKISFLGRDQ